MGLSQQDSLNLYGTVAYTGWDAAGAAADAKAKGISGSTSNTGGNNTVDGILNNAINAVTANVKKITPYEQSNPFSFDEQLATEASTAEYSPYYQQLLSDYTQGVERTKSRSAQDTQNTLDQLAAGKEYYMGTQRRLLDKSLDSTNNGYAGNGLFFSGARTKDVNSLNTNYNADIGNYNTNYQYNVGQSNTSNARTQADEDTALGQYTRDNSQSLKTAIDQGVLQRQNEAVTQYNQGRQQYYDNLDLTA